MNGKNQTDAILSELLDRYPALCDVKSDIQGAFAILADSFGRGGKLLIAGNGGSAADAQHIVGELMKGFVLPRKCDRETAERLRMLSREQGEILANGLQIGLPAIALAAHGPLMTATMNDNDPALCFAQQVYGYGQPGDVFWGISTSGNSRNIVNAALTARAVGMKIIGLTGPTESELSRAADLCIRVPGTQTYEIQEYHLPVYHCICRMLESLFFAE